jgi:hypothetical protein
MPEKSRMDVCGAPYDNVACGAARQAILSEDADRSAILGRTHHSEASFSLSNMLNHEGPSQFDSSSITHSKKQSIR